MDFDDDSVGAGGDSRGCDSTDEVASSGGMAGVDDDGQMGPFLDDGDGGDVEGVADAIFEGFDASFAEDDVAVSLAEDVFGGEEPILDGGSESAFEDDGCLGFSDFAEEVEILHVSSADLEGVGVFFDEFDLPGVHDFGADGHFEFIAAGSHPFEGRLAESLEGVGAGAGLEGAAAEHDGAALSDFGGDSAEHELIFDGAGACDAGGEFAADFDLCGVLAGDLDDGIVLMELAAGEFVGFHDGDDAFDAIEGGEVILVDVSFFADGADDGSELTAREVWPRSHALDFGRDPVDGGVRCIGFHYDDHGTLR